MPDTPDSLRIETIDNLAAVQPSAWDALDDRHNPFLRHAFLAGLEQHGCLETHGWLPVHLLAWRNRQLVGALPLYYKDNSYGEFVFDWAWADAHEKSIGPYYPKLVSAIPFTPVTGPRLLSGGTPDAAPVRQQLTTAALELAESRRLSSAHVLFPDHESSTALAQSSLMRRNGCQYHWHNRGYTDFDDFLAALTSKRRKEIRRERRHVADSGLQIELLRGTEIRDHHWAAFHEFYCDTFHRKWGRPRLTLDFLLHLSTAAPDLPLLILARDGRRYVAGAFALLGEDTLYGRHWGCSADYRYLHFELCYYQTIAFCIEHNLVRLDAGAQGEHKLDRGFEPVMTCSYHWLNDTRFSAAVADFLAREQVLIDEYVARLNGQLAYRQHVVSS
jgi:uncharacterized protein